MKTSLRLFFGILIAILLVYLLSKINFYEVYVLFLQADKLFFIIAFLSYTLGLAIFNLRSVYFVGAVVRTSYWFNFKTNLAGNFVNTITPGAQIGGDPVRAYFIGERYKQSKTRLFGAILAERAIHALVSIFFIMASILYILTFIPVSFELRIIFQTILFSIFLLFSLIIFLNFDKTKKGIAWLLERFTRLLPNIRKKGRLRMILSRHFGNFAKTFKKTIKNKRLVVLGITLSFVYWVLFYFVSYFLFVSFGIKISFFLVLMVVSLSNVVGDFSPTPGGVGLVEGFMIIAYSTLGINLAAAAAVSLLSRFIFYFYSLLLGGVNLLHLESSVSRSTNKS